MPLQPSDKSPAIEQFLEKTSGRTSAITTSHCIPPPLGCGREINVEEFGTWDQLTLQEYRISGWCNTCQDKVFKDPEEDDEAPDPDAKSWNEIDRESAEGQGMSWRAADGGPDDGGISQRAQEADL